MIFFKKKVFVFCCCSYLFSKTGSCSVAQMARTWRSSCLSAGITCAPHHAQFLLLSFITTLSHTALAWDIWLLWNGFERKLFKVTFVSGWKTWKYLQDSYLGLREAFLLLMEESGWLVGRAEESIFVSGMILQIKQHGTLTGMAFPALNLSYWSCIGVYVSLGRARGISP